MSWPEVGLFCAFLLISCRAFDGELNFKAFDDSIIYRLSWEKDPGELLKDVEPLETLSIVTSRNEKYTCNLPKMTENKQEEVPVYEGPNPLQLLSPLFTQLTCSYKLETFWTYELCHGRYIRQYHEEREGKKIKLQEYFLGKWDKEKMDQQIAEIDAQTKSGQRVEVPVRKIEGLSLPYLMITMDSGTVCDLNGQPRITKVYYVCYPAGKHEIFSLEESSTCEYEIVILTPYLCQHPDYRAKESEENQIQCWPEDGSPKKPMSLVELEAESMMLKQQNLLDSLGLSDAKFKVEFREVEGVDNPGQKQTVAFITTPTGRGTPNEQDKPADLPEDSVTGPRQTVPSPVFDPKLVEDFLAGEYCLHGGTGWWKYEFCYGKRAEQYHIEKDGSKTVILLGIFNAEKHLSWLEQNPHKRPKPGPGRKQISHLYSDGSTCDQTGMPRKVEVKLKCKEVSFQHQQSGSISMNAVSLYLLEPNTCEYVLGVEAPFLCSLIDSADSNALIDLETVKQSAGVIPPIKDGQ